MTEVQVWDGDGQQPPEPELDVRELVEQLMGEKPMTSAVQPMVKPPTCHVFRQPVKANIPAYDEAFAEVYRLLRDLTNELGYASNSLNPGMPPETMAANLRSSFNNMQSIITRTMWSMQGALQNNQHGWQTP